ncbi:MAG: hypothetical protein WC641_02995 [Patescibacteria group bacterium]
MRKKLFMLGLAILLLGVATAGYFVLRPAKSMPSELPAPRQFSYWWISSSVLGSEQPGAIEGGVATSEHFVLVSSPPQTAQLPDPFARRGVLPSATNLAVPWAAGSDAGASAAMLEAYYHIVQNVDAAKLNAAEQALGKSTAEDTAQTVAERIKAYLKYETQTEKFDAAQLKRALANGFPVLIIVGEKDTRRLTLVKGYVKDDFLLHDPALGQADRLIGAGELGGTDPSQTDMLIVIPRG